MAVVERIGVVVPVNDEEQRLPRCLAALTAAAAKVAVPVEILVILDACTDGSAAVAGAFGHRGVTARAIDARSVGAARATGMAALVRRGGIGSTWLATTDADSVVPEHWLTAQLAHAAAGARVVAGTITFGNCGERSTEVLDHARREYVAGRHRHVHGANLGFAAAAYCAADGFLPVDSDEDVRLVQRFRANDEPIAWAVDLPVITSTRRIARAPNGFAQYLTTLQDSVDPGSRLTGA